MTTKLPLPRLERQNRRSVTRRARQACQTCRMRKTKCDGTRPVCARCSAQGRSDCVYPERKTVQQQKDLRSMQEEIERYRGLLDDISSVLDIPIADRIAKTLKESNQRRREGHDERISRPSFIFPSLAISGTASEDFNRSEKSRATGYIGDNSEVAWMQHLDCQASKRSEENTSSGFSSGLRVPSDDSIASLNYRLDHHEIRSPEMIHPFVLPPKMLADRLFQVYLEKAHTSLPIIRPDLLTNQYNRCYAGGKNPGRKWLAVFNMVLAIACALSRLSVQKIPQIDKGDIFSARARSLSLSENVLYDHDDLQQVQAEALMAFYLLIQSQISRSWKMIGIAARSGIALGLNLNVRITGLDMKSGEARKQLWWSIFRLENILSIMTGRVSCLSTACCSAPPPFLGPGLDLTIPDIAQPINELKWTINMDKEQMSDQNTLLKSLVPTQSLYFFYMIDLSLIAHRIISEVYTIDYSRLDWVQVESCIAFYSQMVDPWASSIHPSFSFQCSETMSTQKESRFQFSLALNYYSVRIVLSRPYLSSHAYIKGNSLGDPSKRPAHNITPDCVQASLAAIALLPDQPNLDWCYQVPQWWNLLHVLTQAIVILLFHLSIEPLPTAGKEVPKESSPANLVWATVGRGLSWLHCLGETSQAARRAFQFFKSCIQRMAPNQNLNLQGTVSMIELSQTSWDSKNPWLRDSPKGDISSRQAEIQELDLEDLEPMDSLNGCGKNYMLVQDKQGDQHPTVPSTFMVLDTDMDLPVTIFGRV